MSVMDEMVNLTKVGIITEKHEVYQEGDHDILRIYIPLQCKKPEIQNASLTVMQKLLDYPYLQGVEVYNINFSKAVLALNLKLDIDGELCYRCEKKIYDPKDGERMGNNKLRHKRCKRNTEEEKKAAEKKPVEKKPEKKDVKKTSSKGGKKGGKGQGKEKGKK